MEKGQTDVTYTFISLKVSLIDYEAVTAVLNLKKHPYLDIDKNSLPFILDNNWLLPGLQCI